MATRPGAGVASEGQCDQGAEGPAQGGAQGRGPGKARPTRGGGLPARVVARATGAGPRRRLAFAARIGRARDGDLARPARPFQLADFRDRSSSLSSAARSLAFSAFVRAYFRFLDYGSLFTAQEETDGDDADKCLDDPKRPVLIG